MPVTFPPELLALTVSPIVIANRLCAFIPPAQYTEILAVAVTDRRQAQALLKTVFEQLTARVNASANGAAKAALRKASANPAIAVDCYYQAATLLKFQGAATPHGTAHAVARSPQAPALSLSLPAASASPEAAAYFAPMPNNFGAAHPRPASVPVRSSSAASPAAAAGKQGAPDAAALEPFFPANAGVQQANANAAASWAIPANPSAMERWIRHSIVTRGLGATTLIVAGQSPPIAARAGAMVQVLGARQASLRAKFKTVAAKAARDLLDESEQAIVRALEPYGDFPIGKLRVVGETVALKGNAVVGSLVTALVKTANGAGHGASVQQTQRADLPAAAAELVALHRQVQAAEQQVAAAKRGNAAQAHTVANKAAAARGHVKGHLTDTQAEVAAGAGAAMPSATMPAFPVAPAGARTANASAPTNTAGQTYQHARAALDQRWRELEARHPVLAAYRLGARDGDIGALAQSRGGDQALTNMLRVVVPKLGNIVHTRMQLEGEVDPLTLPPVVALAQTRMGIARGSIEAGLLHDVLAEANSHGWKDYAMIAVTVGAAVIAAIPSAGASLVLGAELVGVAASIYSAGTAINSYNSHAGLSNTNLERAKSMAAAEPSLFWLAAALVALPIGAAAVAKAFKQATMLKRAAAAARLNAGTTAARAELNAGATAAELDTARAELNALGAEHGMGRLGEQVVLEPFAGPDLASARDLASKHPGAKVIAAEGNHMPNAAEVAKFRAEGGEFLAERFAESVPAGSVDKIYVRYPLPHEKGLERSVTESQIAAGIARRMQINPKVDYLTAFNDTISELTPPVESMHNFGPQALEKLAPDGTLEVVFWERSIGDELAALTNHRYLDPATGQRFSLQFASSIRPVERATIAPFSGYGIPAHVKVVSLALLKKVIIQ